MPGSRLLSRRTWVMLGMLFALALPFVAAACSDDANCPAGQHEVDGVCVPD